MATDGLETFGIVAACIFLAAVIAFMFLCCYKRFRRKKTLNPDKFHLTTITDEVPGAHDDIYQQTGVASGGHPRGFFARGGGEPAAIGRRPSFQYVFYYYKPEERPPGDWTRQPGVPPPAPNPRPHRQRPPSPAEASPQFAQPPPPPPPPLPPESGGGIHQMAPPDGGVSARPPVFLPPTRQEPLLRSRGPVITHHNGPMPHWIPMAWKLGGSRNPRPF